MKSLSNILLENIQINLKEGIHLVAFVRNKEGQTKTIEDSDYPSKKAFLNDLKANEFTVISIKNDADLWLLDNSNYSSLNALYKDLSMYRKWAKENPNLWQDKYNELKELYSKAMKQMKGE